MANLDLVLILGCVLVLFSILASKVSSRFGVPALLLFLAIGMLAGSEGLGGISFDNAELARSLGVVALALILFAGGLDTRLAAIRPVLTRGVLLSTLGTLIAATLVGLFATLASDLPLKQALLLGAVVSSTDAAAVFAVLRGRSVHLPADVRSLLELESGSNDAMAVFLTVSLIGLITHAGDSPLGLLPSFFLEMGLGGLIGYLMGRAMTAVLNRAHLEHEGLYPVLSLALVLLTYGFTAYLGGNGFLAVYVAAVVMGNRVYIHKRSLTRFHDGLAWLMQIAMFLTLGLLVFPSHIVPVLGVGVLVAVFLMFVARPLSVYLSLLRSCFSLREQTLIGWVGLRGAVPIILATFPLVAGVPGGEMIFNLVFFIVLASALVQGTTIPAVARWLRVSGPAYRLEPVSSGEPLERRLAEYLLPERSLLVGRQVAQSGLPQNAEVVLVRRYDAYLMPTGSTRLRRDDVLLLLADDEAFSQIDAGDELERLPEPLSLCSLDWWTESRGPHAAGPGPGAGRRHIPR
jgi:potassium/hydrogen antiporter